MDLTEKQWFVSSESGGGRYFEATGGFDIHPDGHLIMKDADGNVLAVYSKTAWRSVQLCNKNMRQITAESGDEGAY